MSLGTFLEILHEHDVYTLRMHRRVQTSWLLLGLAAERRPWLALGGPFLSSFACMGLQTHFWPCGSSVSDNIILFLSLHGQSLAESHVY